MSSGGDWKELFYAACAGDLDLVGYHARNGVDLDYAHPEFLSTPLVACTLAGQEAVALYLLEAGASAQLSSELDAMTPLQAARRMGMQRLEQALLARGASAPAETAAPAAPATAPKAWWRWLFSRVPSL